MSELVEDGLHEHAALRFEFEFATDHPVGLHPEAPELVAPMAVGPCCDSGGVDAITCLTSHTPRGVGMQRSTLRDHGRELPREDRLISITARLPDAGSDGIGDRDGQHSGCDGGAELGEPRRRRFGHEVGDCRISPERLGELAAASVSAIMCPTSIKAAVLALRRPRDRLEQLAGARMAGTLRKPADAEADARAARHLGSGDRLAPLHLVPEPRDRLDDGHEIAVVERCERGRRRGACGELTGETGKSGSESGMSHSPACSDIRTEFRTTVDNLWMSPGDARRRRDRGRRERSPRPWDTED